MMSMLQIFWGWLDKLPLLDFADLFIFLAGTMAYKVFLMRILRDTHKRYYVHQLQSIRTAWIEKYGMGVEPILIVQTLRNKIMISSFMASTALIMIIGGFNFVFGMDVVKMKSGSIFFFNFVDADLEIVKVLLIINVLLYSFFHFLWHTRELHNMTLILNVPEEQLRKISPLQPMDFLKNMYLNSGIHFTLGIRGYYFLIPLLLWMFHPLMMMASFFGIMLFLIRRDLGLAPYQR
jgi:uncharacterized membrane protein